MKPSISFFASGKPKGQPRPRAFAVNGKARMYDCGSAEHWKAEIAKAADGIIPAEPWDCPIALHLWFFMPRPKSHFHKNGKLKLTSPHWHRIKPDADNLAKAVMDAMTVMKFWLDDSQVVHLDIVKRYTDADSGCEISIQEAAQ